MLSYGWLNYLREINIFSIVLRLCLAMLIGGILGMERGRKHRPAGLRTYMLVCIGSTLVMMTNQFVTLVYGGADPVRMGAQVVSGIGFLGAGTIIVTGRSQVRGITTAAGLWTAACCGLCIGIGFYEGALVGGLAIYLIIVSMQKFDDILHKSAHQMEVYLEYSSTIPFSEFLKSARDMSIEITEIQIKKSTSVTKELFSVVLMAKSTTKQTIEEMDAALNTLPGVLYLEVL